MNAFFASSCWLFMILLVTGSCRAADLPLGSNEPQRRDDGAVVFRAQGGFRSTQQAAKESALQDAQQQMRWWLSQQEPPIRHAPTLQTIRTKLLIQEELPTVESINDEKMYKIALTASLDPTLIRELRSTDRVVSAVWSAGGVMVVLGIVALVLRLEEWSKGYLTRWLFVGAAGLALALGIVWWLAK